MPLGEGVSTLKDNEEQHNLIGPATLYYEVIQRKREKITQLVIDNINNLPGVRINVRECFINQIKRFTSI